MSAFNIAASAAGVAGFAAGTAAVVLTPHSDDLPTNATDRGDMTAAMIGGGAIGFLGAGFIGAAVDSPTLLGIACFAGGAALGGIAGAAAGAVMHSRDQAA